MGDFQEKKEILCNISLVKALLHYVTHSERNKVQEWLAKLQDEGSAEPKLRNEYSFYLLFNLQNGSLMQPFNKPPPSGKLRPLCRILPDFLYEEVQKQLKMSYCRMNKMLNANSDSYEMPELRCDPPSFHCEQPRPLKGVTASIAVFSSYDDEED